MQPRAKDRTSRSSDKEVPERRVWELLLVTARQLKSQRQALRDPNGQMEEGPTQGSQGLEEPQLKGQGPTWAPLLQLVLRTKRLEGVIEA